MLRTNGKLLWHYSARTYFYTSATINTCTWFIHGYFVFGHAQQCGSSLSRRYIQVKQCKAHHRTTRYDLLRLCLQSSCFFNQVFIIHTDTNIEVTWIIYCISCYCNDSVHQRSAFFDRMVDCNYCIYIIYHTSSICRKHG